MPMWAHSSGHSEAPELSFYCFDLQKGRKLTSSPTPAKNMNSRIYITFKTQDLLLHRYRRIAKRNQIANEDSTNHDDKGEVLESYMGNRARVLCADRQRSCALAVTAPGVTRGQQPQQRLPPPPPQPQQQHWRLNCCWYSQKDGPSWAREGRSHCRLRRLISPALSSALPPESGGTRR